MLNLPDVTLVVAETRCHELMRLTLTDMVLKVKFGGIVIHTNKPELIGIPAPAEYITVPDWPNKIQQGGFYYMDAGCAAKTSHVLQMEWDAGLRDVNCWTDEFLNFDYIGAPWVWAGGQRHSVGNGGFILLSKRMCEHVHANRNSFNIRTDVEYAQVNRIRLEKEIGAKWAPEDVAIRFSYEHYYGGHRKDSKPSFGYHDIFNWPLALPHDEVMRRVKIVMENEYIVRNTPKLRLLADSFPWVPAEIGNEKYDAACRHHFAARQQPMVSPRQQQQIRSAQRVGLLRRHGVHLPGVKA